MEKINKKSGSRELFDYLTQDEGFRRAYSSPSLAYATGRNVAEARIIKDFTQKELAKQIGTSQPNIARIERGVIDSLALLEKIGKALNTEVIPPTFSCVGRIGMESEEAVSQIIDSTVGEDAPSPLNSGTKDYQIY